jgi:hypothetical protein
MINCLAPNSTYSGLASRDWTIFGSGSRAGAIVINDVAGANYAIYGGGYDLTFAKSVSGTSLASALSILGDSTSDSSPDVRVHNNFDVQGNWFLDGITGGHFENYTYGVQLDISELTSGGWARAYKINTSDSGGHLTMGVLGGNTTTTYAYFSITDSSDETGYLSGNSIKLTKSGDVGIGISYNNSPTVKLDVNGAIYSRGGTYNGGTDTVTNAGLVIDENDFIYTRDGSQYLRKLIGKSSADIIDIGQSGTSLIDGVYFYSGSACNYRWHSNTTAKMQLSTSGLQVTDQLMVGRTSFLSETQVRIDSSRQYGVTIAHNYANSGTDFADVLFLQNTNQNNANRCKIGFSTNGTDGQHHRVSINAVRDTSANYRGNLIIEHRQSDATHIDRFLFKYNGDFHADGDVVAYSTSVSDAKLKNKVNTIDNALNKVKNLRGVEYVWNYGTRKDQKDLGVIAQEVEQVLPEIVREKEMMDGDTYKTVDYEKLTAVLIESVKELSAKVEKLENKKCCCK